MKKFVEKRRRFLASHSSKSTVETDANKKLRPVQQYRGMLLNKGPTDEFSSLKQVVRKGQAQPPASGKESSALQTVTKSRVQQQPKSDSMGLGGALMAMKWVSKARPFQRGNLLPPSK